MKLTVEWDGFDEVKRALDKWGTESVAAIERQLGECGEDLLAKSQALAFKKDGDLEASGTKDPVRVNSVTKEISVQVGYHTEYAAKRHEAPGKPGPITRGKPTVDGMMPGRKYLERPLKRYQGKYMQDIADAIRRVGGTR